MPVQFNGSVYGGLADLISQYCHSQQLSVPNSLISILNVERFDYNLWCTVLDELTQADPRTGLGLRIAQHVQAKHLGVLGYLTQSCQTLGEALQRFSDFHRLIYDGSPLTLSTQDNQLIIRWDVPIIFTTQLTNEIAIALMYQFLLKCLNIEQVKLTRVDFTHPKPPVLALYLDYFHCAVRFSQPYSQITVPLTILDLPILYADPILQRLLLDQAHHLLDKLPHSVRFNERLQHAILQGLSKNQYQIEDIARQLYLSPRQLQRHLQQQNTTFSQRIQNIRIVLAKRYLSDPHLSLFEVSLLLGYGEQSTFQRAFKQWLGQTPKQWRNTQHSVTS